MKTIEKYNEIKTAYLSSLKTVTQSVATYDKYSYVLDDFGKFLEQHYVDSEQADIDPLMTLGYQTELSKHEIKRNSMRHYLTILRSFFSWCVAHKFYAEQPILESDLPNREQVEYNLLSEQEIEILLQGKIAPYSIMKTAIRNRALVILLLQSGLRVSELTALKISDLDFEQHTIRVLHGKGDKARYTTFPPLAEHFIKEYLEERFNGDYGDQTAYLFCNENGEQFTRQTITQLVRSYVKRQLGRNDIGAHDLRHAYASYLLSHGTSLEQIQELLGHSNYATTVIYASHLCPKKISQDVNGMWNTKQIAQTVTS